MALSATQLTNGKEQQETLSRHVMGTKKPARHSLLIPPIFGLMTPGLLYFREVLLFLKQGLKSVI